MTIPSKVAKLGALLALATLLTACNGAPSDAQVRQALEAQIQQDLKQVSGISGLAGPKFEEMAESMMPKIDNISPQGCEAAGNDIYNCTVESTVTVMGVSNTNMQEFSFKKNQAGEWKVIR
ncbi:hypothetical protein [Oceanisphaera avium]|uniref:DUF4878 domain-containing protein n=1 Tax=Oceanisphaera avium TaxID=1903694 RepID=A0A1Y0D027_9GAMM|nr:hypothetical protein [Oceanisphaera avium]ART80375.1 hypothetical protein CBP12_09655 [Oceanisphaera avium]